MTEEERIEKSQGSDPVYVEESAAVKEVTDINTEISKSSEIRGFLSFFLYWSIPIGIVLTLIRFITEYNAEDYAGSFFLKAFDVVYMLFYLYFSVYTIYAFVKRKPDAVFIAKYLLVFLFLPNLFILLSGQAGDGLLDNPSRLIISLLWSIVFFVYLCCSEAVKDRIPKATRKLKGFNKVMVILSFVLPALLFGMGILEILGKNGALSGPEKQIEIACVQNRASLPDYQGEGIIWTDMRVEGKQLVYEYKNENVTKDDMDPLTVELIQLYSEEELRNTLATLSHEDAIFSMLEKAGYGIDWRYLDKEGRSFYSVSIPSEDIVASQKPGYVYETSRESFDKIIDTYRKALPFDLFDDCQVRDIFLSDDGKILHYDLLLTDMTTSILAGITPSDLKDHMTELLPLMQTDVPLTVAEMNGKDISFDFHADCNRMWKMSARFTSKDYENLVED